ncbi:MAG: pyridoxamine 5'-phosphate oxidase family protein, partial [Bacteroidota bacterium]
MATQYPEISPYLQSFMEEQKIFFVGTAAADGRVNVSPKGMDSFRVLGPNRIIWLNLTGSGNESAAHVLENGRMTIMFCAFEGKPMILRLYGKARPVHVGEDGWDELYAHFPDQGGRRQIFDLQVDLVQTSCGYAVPLYDYKEDRDILKKWADEKGPEEVQAYWEKKNLTTIDGK